MRDMWRGEYARRPRVSSCRLTVHRSPFTYQIKDKSLPFKLNLSFNKPDVDRGEVIRAVRELLRRLEAEK